MLYLAHWLRMGGLVHKISKQFKKELIKAVSENGLIKSITNIWLIIYFSYILTFIFPEYSNLNRGRNIASGAWYKTQAELILKLLLRPCLPVWAGLDSANRIA